MPDSKVPISTDPQRPRTQRTILRRHSSSAAFARRPSYRRPRKQQISAPTSSSEKKVRRNVYHHPALQRTDSSSSVWSVIDNTTLVDLNVDGDSDSESDDDVFDSYAHKPLERPGTGLLGAPVDLRPRRSIMMLESLLDDVQAFKEDSLYAPTLKRRSTAMSLGDLNLDASVTVVEGEMEFSRWEEAALMEYLIPNNESITPELEVDVPKLQIPSHTAPTDPDSAYSSLERRKRSENSPPSSPDSASAADKDSVYLSVPGPLQTTATTTTIEAAPGANPLPTDPPPRQSSSPLPKPAGPRPMSNFDMERVSFTSPVIAKHKKRKAIKRFMRKLGDVMHC